MPHLVAKGRRVRGFIVPVELVFDLTRNRDPSVPCPHAGEGDAAMPADAKLVEYEATEAGIVLWAEHESFPEYGADVMRPPPPWPCWASLRYPAALATETA